MNYKLLELTFRGPIVRVDENTLEQPVAIKIGIDNDPYGLSKTDNWQFQTTKTNVTEIEQDFAEQAQAYITKNYPNF